MGRHLIRAIGAALVLVGCGDGKSPSAARPDPPAEVVLIPLQLYGEDSPITRRPVTTKAVLLRLVGDDVDVLDAGAAGFTPSPFAPPIAFSSAGTAWAIGSTAMSSDVVLLRSDDLGTSWQTVDSLSFGYSGLLGLGVGSDEAGALTAWVAVVGDGGEAEFPDGPRAFARRLEGQGSWSRLSDLPSAALGTTAIAMRFGRVELVRQFGGLFGADRTPVVYRLTSTNAVEEQALDAHFGPAAFAAADGRGWIGGARHEGDVVNVRTDHAALFTASGDAAWQLQDLPNLASGSTVAAVDLSDEDHGFACGGEASFSRPFCLASEDGGGSWTRGMIATELAHPMVQGVLRGHAGDLGWLILRSSSDVLRGEVLATSDGGRSWSNLPLPRLAAQVGIGPPARNSSAADWPSASVTPARAPSPTPAPTPERPSGGAMGQRAWVVGDSAELWTRSDRLRRRAIGHLADRRLLVETVFGVPRSNRDH